MTRSTIHKIVVIVSLLALWEAVPRLGLVDRLFIPPLSAVLAALGELNATGQLALHSAVSLQRAYLGICAAVLVGLPLGLLLGGWFPRLQQGLEPLMELFAQANPVILAHIIIFFLGIGAAAKVFIIAWLCVWPVAFSTITGIRTVDADLLKAARALGLGRRVLFVKVILPAAAPSIFTGLRLAAGYAFIMLVAAEMMGASSGLGWLVLQSQENYRVDRLFAAAGAITFWAVGTDLVLKLIERRVVAGHDIGSADYLKLRRTGAEAS